METYITLINQLQQAVSEGASPEQAHAMVILIQKELSTKLAPVRQYKKSNKVSVMMPNTFQTNIFEPSFAPEVVFEKEITNAPEIIQVTTTIPAPTHEVITETPITIAHEVYKDTEDETYTPKQDDAVLYELNDVALSTASELNEQYKAEAVTFVDTLTDAPLKDLKKGIGLNDKFLFINELFRGDDVMYERSIKTINNFNIYPEAEYWMERELKIKLGWDSKQESVTHFYSLVRRRFAAM